jgi:hypothetical protein
MRPATSRLVAACLIAIFATTPLASARRTPQQELDRLLAGRTAGKPQTCIPLHPSNSSTTIDRIGIVYDSGGTRYLTRFEGGCPQLDSDRILVTRTPQSQICRGDIATVMTRTPATFVGTCTYGVFVPYKKSR